MSKPKKSKPKNQTFTMLKVGKVEGLDVYAASDQTGEKALSGRNAFEASVPVRGRSLSQNALWAVWYNQISKELKEHTAEYIKRESKLLYGVPILVAEDVAFRKVWNAKFANDTYEQQIFMMRYLPITSLFNRGQGSIYTEILQREYAGRVRLEVL